MLILKSIYVGWNYLTHITILATTTMFMLIFATNLREQNMLMIFMIILIILSMFQNLQSCILLVIILLNLPPMLATIMKGGVSVLFMLLIIISCMNLTKICIGPLLLDVTHSYIKCQCIETKLDFFVTWFILCGVLLCFQTLNSLIGLLTLLDPGILQASITYCYSTNKVRSLNKNKSGESKWEG
jgi:hypothetical protein